MDKEENLDILETKVIDVDIEKEMKKSFLAYSMSVIVQRALPDVRDGLKPVHRRILYTLFEDGLGPDKAYRKCANTVGSVLGRYHPHGDASVYDAMVRLAQDFSMRYMLVDGHGNFGSVDGDPPAAYRYTESRMSHISVEMLTDIEKETVDFIANYDDRLKEPTVLPSRFPNLLVNGSTGIAVGMATNIPPHNMREVIDAMCCLIDNPEADLPELMQYIKGPDFPTGGTVMGHSGIKSAYATGRGKIPVRARAEVTEDKQGKFKIIVTELPYQVNKARLIQSIADLVKEKRIEGISNIDDHSDRNGMHIEIDLKRDASPQIVLNQLYSYSQMQITFGVIMLAIVGGEPKVLTLKQTLELYIDFQVEVVTRRTEYDLKKAQERAHILEGLKIALDFIDEVIAILRSSKTVSEGKSRICERFNLDDIQAQAIVQMPLGRLTGMERGKIEQELITLAEKIANFKDILCNKERLFEIVKAEAIEIRNKFSDERRTEIVAVSGEFDIEDLIPQEECVITFTRLGYIKRQKMDTYKLQRRGGRGISGMSRREEDTAKEMFISNTHDYIMFFTNRGRMYRLKCYEIAECSRYSKGVNIINLIPIQQDEKITSMVKIHDADEENYLLMITKYGVTKRVGLKAFSNVRRGGINAISLDEVDELTAVLLTDGNGQLLVATKKGKAIRFLETDVRAMGRSAHGVRAIRLAADDIVVGAVSVKDQDMILTVSETGYGRISNVDEYRIQFRGGRGIINYNTKKYGDVASVNIVDLEQDIIIISSDGIIIRIQSSTIRKCSRVSKGVKVMRINDDNSKVVAVACVPHDEDEVDDILEDEDDDEDEVDDILEDDDDEDDDDDDDDEDEIDDILDDEDDDEDDDEEDDILEDEDEDDDDED